MSLRTHRLEDDMADATRTLCGWSVAWSPGFGWVRWAVPPGEFFPRIKVVQPDWGLPPSCLRCWRKLNESEEVDASNAGVTTGVAA